MSDLESTLLLVTALLFVSVLVSKLSVQLGMPALLFFLLLGMAASKYRIGILDEATPQLAQSVGVVTLVLILFLGGLETDLGHVRPILRSGILLSTVGTLITALLVGGFLYWATLDTLKITFTEGVLVGAIVASTDAAAVFSILRSRKMRLRANIGPLLELESGSNDVMAYFLMCFCLNICLGQEASLWLAVPTFLREMVIGGLGGVGLGYAMLFTINTVNLRHKGLYPALLIAMVLFTYALINVLHGSGFLAVYIAGIIMGSQNFIQKKSLRRFYQGMSWLMQIFMFITLGLLVNLQVLKDIIPLGIALSLVLMLLARPLSVLVALTFSRFSWTHRGFIAWVGIRGAVPIVFATRLYQLPNEARTSTLFHLIFFIVLLSVILQGTTLYPLAQWLHLEDRVAVAKEEQLQLLLTDDIRKTLMQLEVPQGSPVHEQPIVAIDFPKEALIVLVHRDKSYLKPRGDTVLKADDRLLILINSKRDLQEVRRCLGIAA